MGDPVGDGLVASLGRPGGNVTGLTFLGTQLAPKRLEMLKQLLPKASRVAALWHPGAFSDRTTKEMWMETEAAARTLSVQLQRVEMRGPDELDAAFSRIARERVDAVLTFPSTMLFNERRRLVALAARYRIPVMFNAREFVELGGLSVASPAEDSAVVLLFSLVASGQVKLRRIDGWRKIAGMLNQRAGVAA
jgi:putative ABC transport system substrate-binding protein